MDCCCRPQQPHFQPEAHNMPTSTQTPKLKYSFRTQQATPSTKYTTANTSYFQTHHPTKDQRYGMGSTVASNNELIELQRQREYLLQQDRNLNIFYEHNIIPLQRQVQFYEQEVKVRSIEIMELEDLLSQRLHEQNSIQHVQHTFIQPIQQQHVHQVFLPPQQYFVPPQQHLVSPQQHLVPNPMNTVPVTIRPRPFIHNQLN